MPEYSPTTPAGRGLVEQGRLPQSAEERARRVPYTVADAADIPPGSVTVVELGRHGVGVYNIGGEFFAVNNYCPHEGAPICSGRVQSTNVFDEERREYVQVLEGRVLRCPWHQWEFDITTGRSVAKPERRVKTYDVEIVDGKVVVWL